MCVCIYTKCIHKNKKSLKCRNTFKLLKLISSPPRLLAPQSEVVKDLENLFPFELVVGMNGRVWVKAKSLQQTLIVANLLESCENMSALQRQALFRRVVDRAF